MSSISEHVDHTSSAEAHASAAPVAHLPLDDMPPEARGGPVSNALTRVARLHRIGTAKRLKEIGLFPGQEVVMMILWEGVALRQSALIQRTGLDPSTITKMLQRLEQSGHVRRYPDPTDGRAVLVEATSVSCDLQQNVATAWEGMEEAALAGLSPDDQVQLASLLERVGGNLSVLLGLEAQPTGPEICLVSGLPK